MNTNKKKQTDEYIKRHKLGQFFTSDSLVENITKVFRISYDNKKILEPSFGGCAFIKYINENSKDSNVTAVDIDKKLCSKYSKIYKDINFINSDFLAFNTDQKFDIIIGNPPFNLKTKFNYYDTTEGFLIKSLSLLNKNGMLYFVMPSTILRNKQYQNLRKCIIDNYEIKGIMNTKDYEFLGADIETIVIAIKNRKVKNQKYYYYFDNKKKLVKLSHNERDSILINNTDIFDEINSKLSKDTLSNKFSIYRGHSNNDNVLRGRDINFYSHYLDSKNGNNYFIAQQNIAYRFTCNLVKGKEENVCDTVTILHPNNDDSKDYLCFISEYLNSSVANYFLHVNALNECRLTIHIDKYYIDDIRLPKFNNNFKNYIKEANKLSNCIDLGKYRNKYFYKLLKLNCDQIDEIERLWSYPNYKSKNSYNLLLED